MIVYTSDEKDKSQIKGMDNINQTGMFRDMGNIENVTIRVACF